MMLSEATFLILVAALWGGTNPIIKRSSKGIVEVKANSKILQFLYEVKYLITNINYLMPMAINQLGSILYFICLQNTDLSLSVPVANSLTFVFTAISGWALGEQLPNKNTIIGMILIFLGTALCCYDKHLKEISEDPPKV